MFRTLEPVSSYSISSHVLLLNGETPETDLLSFSSLLFGWVAALFTLTLACLTLLLRFGAFRSVVNRCDIIVTNVFDDIVTAEAPPLPDEPELHIVDVPLNNQAASSSSKVASPLDPTTPTPIPPSKTNVDFSEQPQVSPNQPYMGGHFLSQAKRQLLFEDETHIQSSAIAVVADPQGGFTPLDRDTSAIADANDPPSKRQRPFKQDRH
uniref:Uncharacterized protein n=1 Tax=Populus alba TaxID=43335 RepID=A0A4U5QIJ2_POPAL|nr:hypothetical protein D5086_0000083280 [Populus alba]